MNIQFPDNIDVNIFLREYWQRKPLLLRNALPQGFFTLLADELAGLATEPELESRIVIERGEKPWSLRHGPFSDQDFAELPESHWTLLVQDVDKFIPEVRQLLQYFPFIPDWRVDDVMVSYAPDQGSVGPHIDSYDVFLIQASGQRRWRIGDPDDLKAGLLKDVELGILQQFTTQEEWVLEPGDILYIPPNIPHWGIAEGECMTCSIGFRAPSRQDMLDDWTQTLLEHGHGDGMYKDPPLQQQTASAEIPETAFDQVDQIIDSFNLPSNHRRRWFGQLVTRPKMHLQIPPLDEPMNNRSVAAALVADRDLSQHPVSRFAFANLSTDTICLFASGKAFDLPIMYETFVTALCNREKIEAKCMLASINDDRCMDILVELVNDGHLLFDG